MDWGRLGYMIEIIILTALVIGATLCDYVFFSRSTLFVDNVINIKGLVPKGKKKIALFLAIPITLIIIMIMLKFFYKHEFIFILKRLIVLSLMWPIAVTDYNELRIPNKILICGLILRVPVLVSEFIFSFKNIKWILVNDGVAAIAALIIGILCALVSKGGMGMGDVKLMFVLALFLGIEGICYSLFASMIVTFFVSVVLLITKKKDKKDVIPFAPFVLVGVFLSFILSGV